MELEGESKSVTAGSTVLADDCDSVVWTAFYKIATVSPSAMVVVYC